MTEPLETACPRCGVNLHRENFYVNIDEDNEQAWLHIECWSCTWDTAFKVEHYTSKDDE